MLDALRQFLNGRVLLLAVAAEAEAMAVVRAFEKTEACRPWSVAPMAPAVDIIMTGVGKANAAGAVARVLDPRRHAAVLSVGVAGSYGGPALRSVVVASTCVYGDEGVRTPEGFTDMARLGFAPATLPTMEFPAHPGLIEVLRPAGDVAGAIATVSTCSGTDELAREVSARTGAVAECMEGAAVAHAAFRLGVPAGELRVISNTCGNRDRQAWDLQGALSVLTRVIGQLCTR